MAPQWVELLRSAGRAVALDFDPVSVRGWMTGAELIASVRSLGGTVCPATPFYGWILAVRNEGYVEPISRFAPELVATGLHADDFHGVVVIELDGERFLALRTNEQVLPGQVERALILGGRSLQASLHFAARLKAAHDLVFRERVRVFGTDLRPPAVTPVAEDDLMLPEDFKRALFDYVDGFWRAAGLCAQMGMAATRGLLFVGAPGTGKTLTVRHLLSRYREPRSYVFLTESSAAAGSVDSAFRAMVQEVVAGGGPAIVVLEDVDRLLESGVVTPEFFLNVLDGLFRPSQPVLWIATSNDPTRLEQNVLDRPGRFDQVFVFPVPREAERARLIERFSPWPVDGELVGEIARHSEGLTGAHLREVCYAAALRAAERGAGEAGAYPQALRDALARVKEQHGRARTYGFELGRRPAGFGTRPG